VSLYYGEEISEEQAEDLAGAIEDKFDDIDVEVQMGGQPVYYYLVSVE
jgi:dihydroxyacetone kinase-like predicted kinase